MPNSYNALTTSGGITRRHRRRRRRLTHKQAKPRTSPRVKPRPRIGIKIRIGVAAMAHHQRRSPGSKRNWTMRRVTARWSRLRRSCPSWRRLSARVTSVTSPSCAFLGLRLLLLLLHRIIIAHPPRVPLPRGSPLVGGERHRWIPVSGRFDMTPSLPPLSKSVISIYHILGYFPCGAEPYFVFPPLLFCILAL